MPGDYSRFTDDPKKRFSKLLMQQGKVQLDSDWNELVDLLVRSDRLQAIDTFGAAAVPRATTPDAFHITVFSAQPPLPVQPLPAPPLSINAVAAPDVALPGVVDRFGFTFGNDLRIGAGRCYVGGLRAEAFETDSLLYSRQPFFPGPPKITDMRPGSGLVYLDVWERELTAIEEPSLLEPALGGVDTATRMQTVWQVKIAHSDDFPGLKCGSDLDKLFPPSTGRMTASVVLPPEDPDPCASPESGGFQDVENRHYRVEIHGDPTTTAPARFKFARDPVVSEIELITAGASGQTIIKVVSTGRDAVLGFKEGDSVEITDDGRVLRGEPGILAHVVTPVDPSTREITVDAVVAPAEMFAGHARLIRWDRDPTAAGNDTLITITPDTLIPLENGVNVRFTNGTFHHGDYWMFPARAATHTVGPLNNELPRGIIHHYAALAMVSGLGTANVQVDSDCRALWPPLVDAGDCECIVCVSADEHNKGTHTIQMAIEEAKAKGGGKVCLKPGTYIVGTTIIIGFAKMLKVTGHGVARLVFSGNTAGPVILVQQSSDVTIEGLTVIRSRLATGADAAAITINNCIINTRVQDCVFLMTAPPLPPASQPATGTTAATQPPATARQGALGATNIAVTVALPPPVARGIAIAFDGLVDDVHILRNLVTAGTGVGILPPRMFRFQRGNTLRMVTGIEIAHNIFFCGAGSVVLEGLAVSADIRQNWMFDSTFAAIVISGTTPSDGSVVIDGNRIVTKGAGVIFSSDRTSVTNNVISSDFTPSPAGVFLRLADADPSGWMYLNLNVPPPVLNRTSGIIAGFSALPRTISSGAIIGNRIAGMHGTGVLVDERFAGLMIKQNFIATVAGPGIYMTDNAAESNVSIENNDLRAVAAGDNISEILIGIRVAPRVDAEVAANVIDGVGPDPARGGSAFPAAGILLDGARSASVQENRISNVRASASLERSAGIDVMPPFENVRITGNRVETTGLPMFPSAHCFALLVGPRPRRAHTFNFVTVVPQLLINSGTQPATGDLPNARFGFVAQAPQAFIFSAWGVTPIPLGDVDLLVRGNIFHCDPPFNPDLSIVQVNEPRAFCTFGGNICRNGSAESQLRRGVLLTASTVVADSNQIFGATISLDVEMPQTVETQQNDRWTILGNIVRGQINVNGSALPSSNPYAPLNRQV